MNVKQLKAELKALGIKGYSKMNKAQLEELYTSIISVEATAEEYEPEYQYGDEIPQVTIDDDGIAVYDDDVIEWRNENVYTPTYIEGEYQYDDETDTVTLIDDSEMNTLYSEAQTMKPQPQVKVIQVTRPTSDILATWTEQAIEFALPLINLLLDDAIEGLAELAEYVYDNRVTILHSVCYAIAAVFIVTRQVATLAVAGLKCNGKRAYVLGRVCRQHWNECIYPTYEPVWYQHIWLPLTITIRRGY